MRGILRRWLGVEAADQRVSVMESALRTEAESRSKDVAVVAEAYNAMVERVKELEQRISAAGTGFGLMSEDIKQLQLSIFVAGSRLDQVEIGVKSGADRLTALEIQPEPEKRKEKPVALPGWNMQKAAAQKGSGARR